MEDLEYLEPEIMPRRTINRNSLSNMASRARGYAIGKRSSSSSSRRSKTYPFKNKRY